jgi:hypothetical protein
MTLYPSKDSDKIIPDSWDYRTLRYKGLPFVNWLTELSNQLLQRHEGESTIVEVAAFRSETSFSLAGIPIVLRGFRADFSCSRKWMSQTVREDVSLGLYNHITRRLTVPNEQAWSMGWIDRKAWQEVECDEDPEEWTKPLEPGSFRLPHSPESSAFHSGRGHSAHRRAHWGTADGSRLIL